MAQVPAANTPVSAGQVLGALFDAGVTSAAAPLILAQSAFETGGWARGLWNNNLGNIKYTGSGNFFQITCTEVVNGATQSMPCNFRAYGSLAAGAKDYVAFLAKRGLVAIANEGDLSAYVAKLKAVGYATALSTAAGYAAYQNGMAAWMQKLKNVAPILPSAGTKKILIALAAGAFCGWGLWYVFGDLPMAGRRRNPLRRGQSRAVVSQNIRELRRAGYPQKQAVAIALRKSREA